MICIVFHCSIGCKRDIDVLLKTKYVSAALWILMLDVNERTVEEAETAEIGLPEAVIGYRMIDRKK
jgi:hypothetical protein